jgi:hypothetical protein
VTRFTCEARTNDDKASSDFLRCVLDWRSSLARVECRKRNKSLPELGIPIPKTVLRHDISGRGTTRTVLS